MRTLTRPRRRWLSLQKTHFAYFLFNKKAKQSVPSPSEHLYLHELEEKGEKTSLWNTDSSRQRLMYSIVFIINNPFFIQKIFTKIGIVYFVKGTRGKFATFWFKLFLFFDTFVPIMSFFLIHSWMVVKGLRDHGRWGCFL